LECIDLIEKYTKDCTKQSFMDNVQLQDSIIRRIAHEYFGIDLELTWETVKKDIPRLKKNLLKIKKELS